VTAGPAPDSRRPNVIGGPGCDFIAARIDRVQLSAEFGAHPTMISSWKQELVKRAGELFARGSKAPAAFESPLLQRRVLANLTRSIRSPKILPSGPVVRTARRAELTTREPAPPTGGGI
jgi:hypothetical protein